MSAEHSTDLVLHVGMPRSSTILRPALVRLRPQLRQHGVAFLDAGTLDALRAAEGWQRDDWVAVRRTPGFVRDLVDAVDAERAEVPRGTSPRVLIAHDDLLGRGPLGIRDAERFRPHAATATAQVIQALDAQAVQVVLHVHRQDRLIELAQLERVIDGRRADVAEDFPRLFEPVLDYVELVDRLAALPGVQDVTVRPVELADAGTHAFVEDFLSVLGLGGRLDLSVVGADVMPHPCAYTESGVALARALNPLVEGRGDLALIRDFLLEHYVGDIPTTDLLDRRERAQVLATYAASNRELFARHLPDLDPDSYADDVLTFALGNVLAQPAL